MHPGLAKERIVPLTGTLFEMGTKLINAWYRAIAAECRKRVIFSSGREDANASDSI